MKSYQKALLWSLLWVILACVFNVGVWLLCGTTKAIEFMCGYLVEKSLSIDNLFVFLLIFSYFKTPLESQHRVLFWGILCAFIMRAVFIFGGTVLIAHFSWLMYILGILLIVTSIKMLFMDDDGDIGKNPLLKFLRKYLPISDRYEGNRFWINNGVFLFTPLMIVLIMVEAMDLVFAMDSLPAIFSITLDPFIIYSSNIFAILGLRSLYFALEGVMGLFKYLKYGVASILVFIGFKMLIKDYVDVSVFITLAVIVTALVLSMIASVIKRR